MAKVKDDPVHATRLAEQLAREEWGITQLPIEPKAIAIEKADMLIQPMPASSRGGISGALIRQGDYCGILYATHIDNEGFQNFSIGHELGHFYIPGHIDAVVENGIHESKSYYRSDDLFEREADFFSTGLLMPGYLFDPALDRAGEGLTAVRELKELCGTSLTSTAIRYAQRCPEIAAMVVSEGEQVMYAFLSDTLKEYPGIEWVKKGSLLPDSMTKRFNRDPSNVASGREVEDTVDFQDWFGGPVEGSLHEQVVGLGNYGRTLTILSDSEMPTLDEIEEDEDLQESWTPRFKK